MFLYITYRMEMRTKTTEEPNSEERTSQVGLSSKLMMLAPHFSYAQAHTHTLYCTHATGVLMDTIQALSIPSPPSHTHSQTHAPPLAPMALPAHTATWGPPEGAQVCARKGRRGQRAGTCLLGVTIASQSHSTFPAGAKFHSLDLENEGQSLLLATRWGG